MAFKPLQSFSLYSLNAALKSMYGSLKGLSNQVTASSAPYLVYTALLSQTGTAAPVATVLKNTIGNIIWTRASVGYYEGTLNNAFPDGKTFFFTSHPNGINNITLDKWFDFQILINSYNAAGNQADYDNTIHIEIRVYP